MTTQQIQQLLDGGAYPGAGGHGKLVQTHISWVILDDSVVYKIKKPVQFSFLDFSTLERRQFFCNRELELNSRLAPDMYLDVRPVYENNGLCAIDDAGNGEIVDYALRMRRMDDTRQMNLLLRKGMVTMFHMKQLATVMANFHHRVRLPHPTFQAELLWEDFADIGSITRIADNLWGPKAVALIDNTLEDARLFINRHAGRLVDRARQGLWVDGHGDLHSRNIFLLEEPIVFDCLEFNDHLRHIDVLNEIAFLCMDLDFHNQPALGTAFLNAYLPLMPCLENREDSAIFHFFKLYRANVRWKVATLELSQAAPGPQRETWLAEAEQYRRLFQRYELGNSLRV